MPEDCRRASAPHRHQLARQPRRRLAPRSTAPTSSGDFTYYAIETDSQVGREFVLDEDEIGRASVGGEQRLETGPDRATRCSAASRSIYQRLRPRRGSASADIENPELAARRRQNEDFFVPSVYLRNESELTELAHARARRARALPQRVRHARAAAGRRADRADRLRCGCARRGAQNYRTPSLRDLYQPPTPQLGGAYFLSGNPEPRARELDVDARPASSGAPARWLSLAGAGFYNDIDDHIRSRPAGTILVGTETRLVDPVISAPS